MSRSGQGFALQSYSPYTIVPLFHHLAASGNPKVEKPNLYWEVRIVNSHYPRGSNAEPRARTFQSVTKAKAGEETLTTLTKSILYPVGGRQQQKLSYSAGYRCLLGNDALRTEFVPLLNRLISPPLRPVGVLSMYGLPNTEDIFRFIRSTSRSSKQTKNLFSIGL